MTHTNQDHNVYQGADWDNEVTIYESEDSADTVAITGWELEATFAPQSTGRTDASLTKTNGDGITITDGANGVCVITLDADDTQEMNGDWEWALWVIDEGSKNPLAIGVLTMKETARSRSST